MAKFLVTGGAGFIGSNICERLLKEGHKVKILDDLSTGNKDNIADFINDLEFYQGDIRENEIVRKAVKGADFILHHAAISSVQHSIKDPVLIGSVNVLGTLNILEAARDFGVEKVIIASSASVYGNNESLPKDEDMKVEPISPYAVTKCSAEMYARAFNDIYGLETVCLRYFNVFGPKQSPDSSYSGVISLFIDSVKNDRYIKIFGDGEQTRDFVYVDDVVNSNILAVTSEKVGKGEIINIASGTGISLNSLVETLRKVSGKNLQVNYKPAKKGDIKHSVADVVLAERLLGFKCLTEFEQGISRLYKYI